jgi:hypothetical protein
MEVKQIRSFFFNAFEGIQPDAEIFAEAARAAARVKLHPSYLIRPVRHWIHVEDPTLPPNE